MMPDMPRALVAVLAVCLATAAPRTQEIPLGLEVAPSGAVVAIVYDLAIGQVRIASRATQGPAATPSISSSWTDEDGVDHVVVTPVTGGGEQGMLKAMERHRVLVMLMQRHYPPMPTTPAPQ